MAETKITVSLPDETDEAEAPGLSLGNFEEDDDAEREEAGLNSPKGPATGGLSIPQDNGNTGNATPNTLRTKYDVNSPRKKNEIPGGWSAATGDEDGKAEEDDAASSAALAGLVTQVSRDDNDPMMQGTTTSDDLKTEDQLKKHTTTQRSGGICSCFSALFSCCSSPTPPPDADEPTQKPTKQKQNQGGKAPLIETKPSNAEDAKDVEDSYTETEYPPGLLPPLLPEHEGLKCLVLDLDETLVHSSFKPIPNPDFIIPVEIDNIVHRVYVMKRPYVDEFLLECSKHYEIVIFTASLAKYADPLLDKLDIHKTITHRLFRESCVLHGTAYVKDLRTLGRKLRDSIIVDNSPPSYLFQPINAIPILSWFDDQTDTQLKDILPCLTTTLKNIKDVRKILDAHSKSYRWLCQQANKPLELFE